MSIVTARKDLLALSVRLHASMVAVAGALACFVATMPYASGAEPAAAAKVAAAPKTALVGTEAFLGSAWSDISVTLRAENLKRFGDSGLSNPIEKLQLRLNQDEYIEDRKAIVRASPRGWNEYKLMRSLSSQTGRIEEMTYRQGLTKALFERYEALIDYRFAIEDRRVQNAMAQNAKRALSMQSASASNSKASAHDLLKAREGVQGSQFKLAEADAKVRRVSERLKSLDAGVQLDSISFGDWPTPLELAPIVDRMGGSGKAAANLETQLAKEHASRMHDSVEYDIQRDTKILDYVELSYSEKANQESRYGFEVGINIPGFAGKDFGNQEKARQLVRYEIDAREKEREQQLMLSSARELLARSVETYKIATSTEDSATEDRIRSLARNADPLLANAIDHEALGRDLRAIESARDAYKAYLELLRATGSIDEKSRTNFLSRGLRELRP